MSDLSVSIRGSARKDQTTDADIALLIADMAEPDLQVEPEGAFDLTRAQLDALASGDAKGGPSVEKLGTVFEPSTRHLYVLRFNSGAPGFKPRALGVAAAKFLLSKAGSSAAIYFQTALLQDAALLDGFLLGLHLRHYSFAKYKTHESPPNNTSVEVFIPKKFNTPAKKSATRAEKISSKVHLCRDLVNEPPNILTTSQFKDEIQGLASANLEVEIFEEAELAEMRFSGLLTVGRGSHSPSYVVVMRDKRNTTDTPDVCLVGKGVCFDSGGLSLKSVANMKDMKMDMAGAAVVVSTMCALAEMDKPTNTVGLVGLVENSVDGDAYRPGDILTMRSGKTVEVVNTDAEGRLVLADVLHYGIERFQPKCVIDVATLTGGIITALGHDIAGVFSNSDALSNKLRKAAVATDEELWTMPLRDFHRRFLESDVADVKQAGGPAATSISAAMFLAEFVGATPWAHIDIAGVAMTPREGKVWPKGASGWGVQTLTQFCATAAGQSFEDVS